MIPNFLFSNTNPQPQYLLELVGDNSHHVWLTELKSKEPGSNFLERFLQRDSVGAGIGMNTLQLYITQECFTDKSIIKRFVMFEKAGYKSDNLDMIDPLVRWSFQCGFFNNFLHNVKTFRLSKIGGLGFVMKAWDLHLCSLAHSTILDTHSGFLDGTKRTIRGETISINPNFILDVE